MISVILNVYKRPGNLKKQLDAIFQQSVPVKPENIHVWYNNGEVPQNYPDIPGIKTYTCNWNTKFWGRFTAALLCTTKYVAVFDDDIFPAKDWFKNCLDTIQKPESNGILGGSGIIVPEQGYRPHRKIGWNGKKSDKATQVDLVGHAWFFRQEWAKYLWYEKPATWANGEDIMFSYLAQKYGKVNTFVPPHPETSKTLWCTDEGMARAAGSDDVATYVTNRSHYNERDGCVEHCKNNGWKVLRGSK